MRLLIQIGYDKFLLPESADAAAVLGALAGAVGVEEKQEDYSSPKMYALKKKLSMDAPTFVSDEQLLDEDEAADMDITKLRADNAKLHSERAAAAKELADLKAKVDGLTAPADA